MSNRKALKYLGLVPSMPVIPGTAEARSSRSSLTGTAGRSPSKPIGEELIDIKRGLNFIDEFVLNRAINREAKRVISDACLQYLAARHQELIHRLSLEVGATKQRQLAEHLEQTDEIKQEIAARSDAFVHALLIDGWLEKSIEAAQEQAALLARIEALHRSGAIEEESFDDLAGKIRTTMATYTDACKERTAGMVQAHLSEIELTLVQFSERALAEKRL